MDLFLIVIYAIFGGVCGAGLVQLGIAVVRNLGWWLDERRAAAERRERERCREADRILLKDADRRRTIHKGHL